jgi:hypothetical protein
MVEKWDENPIPHSSHGAVRSTSETLVNTGVFELAVGREVPLFSTPQVISKPPHSATLPPLRLV